MCKKLICFTSFVLVLSLTSSVANADMVAGYNFNGTFNDASGNGFTGVPTAQDVGFSTNIPPGHSGQSLSLQLGGYVDIPLGSANPILDDSDGFTVMCWALPDDGGEWPWPMVSSNGDVQQADWFMGAELEGNEISYFMDQVAERGGVVVQKTAGSGAALDQQAAEAEYKADPTGTYPVGLLLDDMVNKDLTRTHLNFQKSEQQKGSKVALLRDGWVVTNMLEGTGVVPTAGQRAYVGNSGLLTATQNGGKLVVGRFDSIRDEDGYVKVYIALPTTSTEM